MANDFKKIKKIEFEPLAQEPIDPVANQDTPLQSQEFTSAEDTTSAAQTIVTNYDKTIEFMKFVEGLLREQSQVQIEIDPEDDPEVWLAMQRVFSNPSTKLDSNSYFQVLDALEAINEVELLEQDPRNDLEEDFLSNLPNVKEADESEILDETFQETALDEIENKAKVKRSEVFVPPEPPPPPPPPPEPAPDKRRWSRLRRRIQILNEHFRIVWDRKRPRPRGL